MSNVATPFPQRWSTPIGPDVAAQGKVDACVIGSGAGGGPVALSLARAGYRVVVLEKGPAYNQRDFVYDEVRTSRRDFFVPSVSEEPHVRVGMDGAGVRTSDGWTANCLGGATVHFSGFTHRLHPEDLKLRSLLGPIKASTLADWPIRWEQLVPYYERAEYALGVSGVTGRNPFEPHSRPFPLPPLRESVMAKLVDEACAKLGLHSYPTPRAIVSQAWAGRARCRRSHFCGSYGCETGAKSSSLAALIPEALATGKCQVRPMCMAYAIETDDAGRARAVQFFDAKGKRQRLETAVVIVACSTIESARLLLLSRGKAHPHGVGNHSGQVGVNLMFSGFGGGDAEFARDAPQMQRIDWREPFVNRSVQDLYLIRRGGRVHKGGTLSFLFPHSNPIFRAEMLATGRDKLLWGEPLKTALRHFYREVRVLEFEVFSETLPIAKSRVELDPEVKDKWGLPVARFTNMQHERDREANGQLVDKGLEILQAMGGTNVRTLHRYEKTYWLQAGTCRFGTDAETSVLDPDCRVHTARNVFVTDGSFMPTSGAVPNTLTIEANAFRVADRIVALGKEHGLF